MLENIISKETIPADGVQRQWDIPFTFYKLADVGFYVSYDDGKTVEKITQNIRYEKDGNYFVYPTEESKLPVLPVGAKVLLLRETENKQFETSETFPFNSRDIERMADNLTMQIQDLKRDSLRSVKSSLFSEETGEQFSERFFETASEAIASANAAKKAASDAEESKQESLLNAQNAASSAVLASSAGESAREYANTAKNDAAKAEASAESAKKSADFAEAIMNGFDSLVYTKEEIDNKVKVIEADIDELGDQVSEIESKIPAAANATNQLADKAYVDSAVAAGGGGGSAGSADVAEALRNQNEAEGATEHLYNWVGTLAEYETQNIATEHPEWIVLITDDDGTGSGGGGSSEAKWGAITGDINTQKDLTDLIHNTEMGIRADVNETDSELQTQITAQASAIVNKVDVTGDTMTGALNLPELNVATSEGTLNLSITAGVATIATNNGLDIVSQTKFDTAPTTDDSTTWADALDTSLVRKAQVATAIAEAGGGGSLPDNVYTQDNLIAGDNVTFSDKKITVGLDDNTIALFHLDDNVLDSSNHKNSGVYSGVTTPASYIEGKFGKAINVVKSNNESFYYKNDAFTTTNSLTLDYWCYLRNMNPNIMSSINIWDQSTIAKMLCDCLIFCSDGNKYIVTRSQNGVVYDGICNELKMEDWNHLAIQIKGNIWEIFVNGKLIKTTSENAVEITQIGKIGIASAGEQYIDEVRLSNVIRYDGDFTPETKAYSDVSETKTVKAVNAIIPEVDIPEGIYTQSNLLGGKDIEIVPEPVEGGIDEYTLGVFHFDDGYTVNAVSGKDALGNQAQMLSSDYAKFGTKSGKGFDSNSAYINCYANTGLTEEGDWTVDHWARFSGSGSKYQASLGVGKTETSYDWWVQFNANTQLVYVLSNSDATIGKVVTKASASISLPINEWVHLAAEKHGNTINGYLNGVKVISFTDSSVRNTLSTRRLETYPYCYIDELRFCTVARYKGENFTPPTKAYEVSKPTGNMVVNFTGKAVDLSGKADTDLDNTSPSTSFKEMAVGWSMPDYENGIEVTNIAANVFVQVEKDSFVLVFGSDPRTEDYHAYVSPDGGTTKYTVGRRNDDKDSYTQTTSFTFFVPAGWYFSNGAESGSVAYVYPLRGVK